MAWWSDVKITSLNGGTSEARTERMKKARHTVLILSMLSLEAATPDPWAIYFE